VQAGFAPITLHKGTKLTERARWSFDWRYSTSFNHAQFYPNGSVDATTFG
jgi:hypothetical protein